MASVAKTLYDSIINEDLNEIDACLRKRIKINNIQYMTSRKAPSKESFIPLIHAINNSSITVVDHLLQKGADICREYTNGETPLSVAVKHNNLKMIEFLLDNGAEHTMQTAFSVAVSAAKLETVKYMMERGACVNWKYRNGHTPLSKSIESGSLDTMNYLTDNGAHLHEVHENIKGALLTQYTSENNLQLVQFLVEKGTNANSTDTKGQKALVIAAKEKCDEIAKFLINSGADVNGDGIKTPLMELVRNGNFEMIKYIVELGANLNCVDELGNSALSIAAAKNYDEIATFLIDSGADINGDSRVETPLMEFVGHDNFEMVKYITERGANINCVNRSFNSSALSIAASYGYFQIVKYLMEFGADIKHAQSEIDRYAAMSENFHIYLQSFRAKRHETDSGQDEATITVTVDNSLFLHF